jgi:hypothetical protein
MYVCLSFLRRAAVIITTYCFLLQVQFSMLPVGHTHEDIDARFSFIARRLYQKDTETLEEFLNVRQNIVNKNNLWC